MENIKSLLLSKLEPVNEKTDPRQEDDEAVTLTSEYFDEETQTKYELCVELIAHKSDTLEPGNYHADRGDYEGGGVVYDVCGISIQNIYVFVNDDEEAKFTITNQEAEAAIKY